MPKAQPLARKNPRASDSDIRSATGPSGPAAPPGHHHISYHKHGDHRQEGLHTGPENSSKPVEVEAGRPKLFSTDNNGGNGNGNGIR
jgi:hypothetical protein